MPQSTDSLRHGASVYGTGGAKLGTLHAIILDPAKRQVTHLAINAGPHFPAPGFGDPEIVSVDIDLMRDVTHDRVEVELGKAQFAELPLYEHRHFFEVPDDEQPPPGQTDRLPRLTRLWNTALALAASLGKIGTNIAVPAEHFAKASFERHILNDAPVRRKEPSLELGEVEEVVIDEATDEIVALVVREGHLFAQKILLPMRYITEIRDGVIHAAITDAEIEGLEPYKA